MAQARLTREEKKAQTRERLLEAAATVFARRGFAAASLDEVAEEAGLTKGAVYSNFANKEDLVLAVLDDRLGRRMTDIPAQLDFSADFAEQADKASRLFMATSQEEQWLLVLGLDFAAHAARNAEFRERYAARHRENLRAIAGLIRQASNERHVSLPLPPEEMAIVFNALGMGLALEQLHDPTAVPDDLFGRVITLLYAAAGNDATRE